MRRGHIAVSFTIALLAMGGCGGPQPGKRPSSIDERVTPIPLPTRIVSPDFATRLDEVASQFPDFDVAQVGPYWVQLTHRDRDATTIAVGVEPRLSGSNAEAVMDDTLQGMGGPSSSRVRETGSFEDEAIGRVYWLWSRDDTGERSIDQLAFFATHPVDGLLLLARYEFPSDGDDIQARLAELTRATVLIGPVL